MRYIIRVRWFRACSSIGTCNPLTLAACQCTMQTMLSARAHISLTFTTTSTFYQLQKGCWSGWLLHPYRLQNVSMLGLAEEPAPFLWVHNVPNPNLHLMIYMVAVVSSSIRSGSQTFWRQVC